MNESFTDVKKDVQILGRASPRRVRYLQDVPKRHIVVSVLREYVSLVIQNVALNNTGTSCIKKRGYFSS